MLWGRKISDFEASSISLFYNAIEPNVIHIVGVKRILP